MANEFDKKKNIEKNWEDHHIQQIHLRRRRMKGLKKMLINVFFFKLTCIDNGPFLILLSNNA